MDKCIFLSGSNEEQGTEGGWVRTSWGEVIGRVQVLKHQGWRSKFKIQETGFHSVGLSLRD